MRIAMLSCAFASAILSHTAFPSQDAVAGSSEAVESPTVQAQPRVRLAQNTAQTTGAAGKPGPVAGGGQRLPTGTEAAAHGEISVLTAAAKAEKGKEARPQDKPAFPRSSLSAWCGWTAPHGLVTSGGVA
jgi:hypothetical protein